MLSDHPQCSPTPQEEEACCCRHRKRTPEETKKLSNRLSRIEGQVRGIRGMIERDAYCPDILILSQPQQALPLVLRDKPW